MPIIKSAKKKLRADKKRTISNKKSESLIDGIVKKTKKKPTKENLAQAFKAIDKGVKKGIMHKNKAARLKSKLSILESSNKASKKA
jgi:small subunit ribosomal protein S20